MKDFLFILKRNFLSPIVIAIFVLASALLYLGENNDAWFISVVIFINTMIGVIQEVRAQRALRKLELMNAPRAHLVKKGGKIVDIMVEELKVGDVIQLMLGDEIPADSEIISSQGLETDEGLLTGESAPVEKDKGSIVYAASAVVAGSARARVVAVGADTKAGSMTAVLKRYKPRLTPLQRDINRAITWLTYGALILAAAIFVSYYLSGVSGIKILKTIIVASVTVVPEGLLLASSLLLAYGSIRLANAKVLPQKLAAIEAMALLNILCVDKTGTLTSDEISFESIEFFDKNLKNLSELVGIVAKETDNGSPTGDAIAGGLPAPKNYKSLEILAFSSKRKFSGAKVELDGKTYGILLGAPEYLDEYAPLTRAQKKRIELLASDGKRVLLAAVLNDPKDSVKKPQLNYAKSVGIVVLSNELRSGVEKTVTYLQDNGVTIKVISGDSPKTVSYIAKQAGIKNYKYVLTGDDLTKISDKSWNRKIARTTIFARVLPEQKEHLVDTFKKLGNFTGMVGDGVNDALALKKSDLGVAMYAGAAATRRVADIVLLNNSFNSLPLGMKLGNKIMQAIEIIASLFFHKIIYGVVLLLSTIAIGIVYPFEPRHITFMNIFLVTMPTIMWTLFPPVPEHRVSPKYFWKDTLFAVAPIAVLSGLMVASSYALLRYMHPENLTGVSTTTVLIATFFGIYLVFLVPRMFEVKNTKKAQLARILYVLAVFFVMVPSFGVSLLRDFFDFTTPAWRNTWPLLFAILVVALLQWRLANDAGNRFKKRKP